MKRILRPGLLALLAFSSASLERSSPGQEPAKAPETPRTTTGDVPGAKPAESPGAPASPKGTPADLAEPSPPPQKAIEKGTLRLIRLPAPRPELPDGPGRGTVLAQCAVCHTPNYITLQPPLSRESWQAVMTKMRTTYSAPVPEEKVGEIMDYLMAVRGAASSPPPPPTPPR